MAAATAMLVVGLAGMAVSAYSQHKAGKEAKKAGDFNANVAELQADDAIARGAEEESRFRTSVKGLIGTARTGFAGQGVDVGVGSAVDVQGDAAYLGELDARQIRSNAQREAWGFRVDAENQRRGGAAAQRAGNFGAAGTLIGGGASLVSARYGWGGSARTGGRG